MALGAALATTGIGAAIGSLMEGPDSGVLVTGSPNVFINGLPATMVERGLGECAMHGGVPDPVATGSARVFINGRPAARVTDLMTCGAVIKVGSPNVFIGGGRQSPVCSSLRADEAAFERFRIDAQAASAAYSPPESRVPPEGYRNATDDDLKKLRLKADMLEHPVDPDTKKATEFRAAVFINNKTGAPIIAYKGTTSWADWKTNFAQGLGQQTFYYDQAQRIAQRVQQSPAGAGAHLTGHSLGGGMASAGARASGLPATTFNAAGLNAKTVPHPVDANIDAVYVKGEPVRGIQAFSPASAATRTYALNPPSLSTAASNPSWKVRGSWLLRHSLMGAEVLGGNILLHFMDNVDAAMAQKRDQIERALEENGCL